MLPVLQLSISDYIGIAGIVAPFTLVLAVGLVKVVSDIAALKVDIKNIKEDIAELRSWMTLEQERTH